MNLIVSIFFFLFSKTSALFVYSLLNTKTLTNNQNTKVYSLKHETNFHIYVTSKHSFKLKTKNTTQKTLTHRAIIFFFYILLYSLALSFSSSLHILFLSSSYNFFLKKNKKLHNSFILLFCLFIYLHTFFSWELKCLLQASPS
jgi:hypothetical protein